MSTILLKNITLNGAESDILIEGGLIARISAPESEFSADETVDCSGKAAVPGFVNMHTHAAMSMMRGVGEDMVFHDWLKRIWEIESGIDEEYVYHAAKVACLEMIRTGTTTFNDHYWHVPAAYRAAKEMGLRAVHAYVFCDRNDPAEAARQKDECRRIYEESESWDGKAGFAVALHAIYSVSEDTLLWGTSFAREHGLQIHIHVSETEKEVSDCMGKHGGMSPVEYLDSLGILGPDVVAAHTLWLSDRDVEILGRRKVNCVHNINSNLKLASGYRFRYNELRDAGANVCLGTDGCASSNNLDMLEAMKTAAIVQKAWRGDASAMPSGELLDMATCNGARALGLESGVIEAGRPADMMIVDTGSYHFLSPGSFLANFIYSAHSDCIDSLICDGKFLMKHRVVEGEREILAAARKVL